MVAPSGSSARALVPLPPVCSNHGIRRRLPGDRRGTLGVHLPCYLVGMSTTFPGFDGIASDPGVLGGKPHVRGTRLSVQQVLHILSQYPDPADLAADYPELTPGVVQEVLRFAAVVLEDRFLFDLPPEFSAA